MSSPLWRPRWRSSPRSFSSPSGPVTMALELRPVHEPADDGGRQYVHPSARTRRRPPVRQVVGPQDPRDELARAAEDARVLDLVSCVRPGMPVRNAFGERRTEAGARFDAAMVDAEARYEALRDALTADVRRREVGAGAGLVSVLTSDTRPPAHLTDFERRRSSVLARAASATVGQVLGCFAPDPDAGRIARLRMAVGFSARVHLTDAPTSRVAMVTLTYRDAVRQWEPRQVSGLLKTMREFLRRRGHAFRYAWVAELQKRGVAGLHYHIAVWLPPGVELPMPDRAGWWPHGYTRIEYARSAPAYLMKYLSKGSKAADHQLPHRARCYGVGGLGAYWRTARRWLGLPGFVRARADVLGSRDWVRWPGGGWMDTAVGRWYPSEWRLANVGCERMLERVHDHGRPFVADGVFSFVPWAITPSV